MIVTQGLIAYKDGDDIVIHIVKDDNCETHKIPMTSITSIIDVEEGAFRV